MVARIGTGEGYAGAAFAPEAWGKRRYAPSVRFVVVIGLVVAVLSGSAGASDGTSLRIRYWSEGKAGSSIVWTLRCAPPGGTHPRARRQRAGSWRAFGRRSRRCRRTSAAPRST